MKLNFRPAVVEAANQTHLSESDRQELHLADTRGPLLYWRAMEHIVTHKYQHETGVTLPQGFDWLTVVDWLVAHLPMILSLILTIFAL